MKKEFVLCAAIYINDGEVHEGQPQNIQIGFVICGRRHHNCYQTIKDLCGENVNSKYGKLISAMSSDEIRKHQGFITSEDRYVDRKDAWKIAKENEQIQFGLESSENEEDSILISENLY